MADFDGFEHTRDRVPGDIGYENATASDLAGRPPPYTPPAYAPPAVPARRSPAVAVAVILLAVLVAVVLLAGLLVVSRSAAPDPAVPPQVGAPPAAVEPDARIQVVYEITASGPGSVGEVSYTDQDGDIIRRSGISLPWRTTFTTGRQSPLVLHAQRKSGGDAKWVTCSIIVDGKVVASATEQGRYAAPQC
ncbi:MmpS family transport accessory protein [Actinoplanes sp. OR16]|uniref:MmpS family transport accessory protein n=1 Tax=Actinoplanes sp. OR16 TaxID=946334 RepID=UPI00135F1BD6|nr:MmpS family transport accessory protein [Actinoplanes sp. OR16]